jgi:hypothetical protein
MKKLLFALIIGLTFTACEKDEVGVITPPVTSPCDCNCGTIRLVYTSYIDNFEVYSYVIRNSCSGNGHQFDNVSNIYENGDYVCKDSLNFILVTEHLEHYDCW